MEVRGQNFKSSFVASGNLSQWRFFIANGLDAYLPTSGVLVTGVTQSHPNDNEHLESVTLGHTKITLASSLGNNIPIATGNNGFAIRASSGQFVAGLLVTGTTSGCPGEMILSPGYLMASSY